MSTARAKQKVSQEYAPLLEISNRAAESRVPCRGSKQTRLTGLYQIGLKNDTARPIGQGSSFEISSLPEPLRGVISKLRRTKGVISIELDERCSETTTVTPLIMGAYNDDAEDRITTALLVRKSN